jgi:rhamnulokinase
MTDFADDNSAAQAPTPAHADGHTPAHADGQTPAHADGQTQAQARPSTPTSPATSHYVAIDLGAGSGRVLLGALGAGRIELKEVHRFRYEPRHEAGHLRWDGAALFDGLIAGLRNAQAVVTTRGGTIASIGVDSWGVDYGLLDADGRLLQDPISYRDYRTQRVPAEVFARVPRADIFARTGIQFLQLNTLYQLFAHARAGMPPDAAHLLLIPDLCHHFLCGAIGCERTNASTTQLLSAETGEWDDALFEALDLPRALMPPLIDAGRDLGPLTPQRQQAIGLAAGSDASSIRIIAPATHDTASAVIGTPLETDWAFVSSGTWSLIGVERQRPLIAPAVAEANFTNERGAFGTVRFLKNVMGLWLLESCRKEWAGAGYGDDMATLLKRVAAVPGFAGFIFPDAARFFNPVSMTRELRAALTETSQPSPFDPVILTKSILDSLALRYAAVLETIERLTGTSVPGLHIVGGGCLNDYLNQATANAAQRPVVAGPVEATAAGNLIVQAITDGTIGSIADARRLMRDTARPRRFEPRDAPAWREATERYRAIEARALEQERAPHDPLGH